MEKATQQTVQTWPDEMQVLQSFCEDGCDSDGFHFLGGQPRRLEESYNWLTNEASMELRYRLCFSSVHSVDKGSVSSPS